MFGQPLHVTKPAARPRRCVEGRDVRGSIPYQIGIIAKHAGDDWKSRNMLVEQRRKDDVSREKSKLNKEALDLVVRHEFALTTEKKTIVRELRHRVDAGLEAARRDLDVRREKLRCMLLEEEAALTREYVDKAQRVNEKKLEEMKLKADEIRNKREAERQKVVHEKRIQQYIERCEDLRSLKSKRSVEEAKRGQEYQMKEREYMKEQQREVEKMWAEVSKKEYEAKVAREIEEARKKFHREKEIAEMLLLQQKSIEELNLGERQKIKDEEAKMKVKVMEELREEQRNALENKMRAQQQVYNDLMEQINRREEFLKKMAKEEKVLEDAFCRVAEAELQRELSSRQDYRETLKRETQLYRNNLAELRKQRASEEAELEKILQQEKDKIEAERKDRMMQLKAAREKLKEEVLRGRLEQVERQLEVAQQLRRQEDGEYKLQELIRQQNARLTVEHDQQIRLLKRKYAQDLLDQIEYRRGVKEREREEIEREWKTGLLEEECYKRLIKELLSRPENIEPHPFYKVIEASVSLDDPCKCPVPEGNDDPAQRR